MKELYSDLDDKSREAAEKISIAFDENAWTKMKMLLDRDDNKPVAQVIPVILPGIKRQNQNRKWLMLAMLLLFIGIGSVILKNDYTPKSKTTSLPDHTDNTLTKTPEQNIIDSNIRENHFVTEYRSPRQFKIHNHIKSFSEEATIYTKPPLSLVTMINFNKGERLDEKQSSTNRNIASENIKINADDTSLVQNKKLSEEVTGSTSPHVERTSDINKKSSSEREKVNQIIKNKFFKNIGFSVFASPEINSVKFKSNNKITTGYGAGISYSINKHFTLQAQFAKTRKVYVTDRKGYNPVIGSSLVPIDTLKVNADCKVWDIPVTLRYDFTSNLKNDFFISAGISSYIMKKEVYDFTYYDRGAYETKQRIIENENKHSFCNLNLSAGYQYWPAKKWSIGFEPYLKLPLSGVGAGKVKLTSAGILFSLTFKPLK